MEKYFENIKKRFDTKAIQYSGDYNKIAGFPQEKSLDRYRNINEFLKHDKSEPISRLGDIGCAAGELTRYFVGEYDEIYGVDISSECLKLLNRSCPTIKTVCANINNLPFENNFFDSLIVYSVLHYLPNWRNVAECIWGLLKILKPGGRLYVGDIEPSVVIYIRNIVRKYGELVNYPLRITPHMFRHTVATLLLEQDVDIRCIQQILGHASILTTQIYTHVAGAKQREIMETRHPRNGFSLNQSASAADYPRT